MGRDEELNSTTPKYSSPDQKKLKNSVSKVELSTNYTKGPKTARNLNKSSNIDHSKILARESISRLYSPGKSLPISYKESEHEIADETSPNIQAGFMDEYYASNGYFSFSQNRKEMRAKDAHYDRLQTFIDERLLEIASQISVKQRLEEQKEDGIVKLEVLKDNIGMGGVMTF